MLIEHFQEKIQKMMAAKTEEERKKRELVQKWEEEKDVLQKENKRLMTKLAQVDSMKEESEMNESRMVQQIALLKKETHELTSRFEPIKNTLVKFLDCYTKNSKEYEEYLRTLTMMLGFLPAEQTMLVELSKPAGKKKFSLFK